MQRQYVCEICKESYNNKKEALLCEGLQRKNKYNIGQKIRFNLPPDFSVYAMSDKERLQHPFEGCIYDIDYFVHGEIFGMNKVHMVVYKITPIGDLKNISIDGHCRINQIYVLGKV